MMFIQACLWYPSQVVETSPLPFMQYLYIIYVYLIATESLHGHMIQRAMLAVAYATGRASHARKVKGDDPDKKGYPGPTVWGLDVGQSTPHHKTLIC
jgi:hypothetical protein